MTESRTIPLTTIITTALWACVWAALTGAWVFHVLGQHGASVMLGFTACAFSPVAGVATVRCFFLRTHRLIRATYGLDAPRAGELRTVT